MMRKDTITLGADVGGTDADEIMSPWFMPLRKLLAKHCTGPYSTAIDEFAFVLRIDGNICSWKFEGCDNLRVNRRRRNVTIDIGIPKMRWESNDGMRIGRYLIKCIFDAFIKIIGKIKMLKIDIQDAKLLNDFENVRIMYIEQLSEQISSASSISDIQQDHHNNIV